MLGHLSRLPTTALCLLAACATPGGTPLETETETAADGAGTTETGGDTTGASGPLEYWVFDEVVFYDGYAATVDAPVPDGVIRHRNDLYATRVDDEIIELLGDSLRMEVFIGALCDNYDRIGSVFVSFVPDGAESYDPSAVPRFEIARFITPFMNMNRPPTIVPYEFEMPEVVPLLRDRALREGNDVWFELSVFGVPYAANTEINGCEGRNDTSRGALVLHSDAEGEVPPHTTSIPLAVREAFNNYQDGASDMLGTTRKTVAFDLDGDSEATRLVLITSNHGANAGGEEYIRRDHFVYLDGELVHQYRPGRESCEPFRIYNTQGNGIYGPVPKTDAEWQSFSNWCPGDKIDTRIIDIGARAAGTHEFVIDVPDAQFAGGEGDFPFSLYVQAGSAR